MRTVRIVFGFCVLLLAMIGLLVLASAGEHKDVYYVTRQGGYLAGALVVGFAAAKFDYRRLAASKWMMPAAYCITMCLLVAVLATKGAKGSKRWLNFGAVNFQPGELAKFMAVMLTAWWAVVREKWRVRPPADAQGKMTRKRRVWRFFLEFMDGYLPLGFMLGAMAALILLEPDFGTTFLVMAGAGLIMFVDGQKWRYIFCVWLPLALLVVAIMWLNPNRHRRMAAFGSLGAQAQNTETSQKNKDGNAQIINSIVAFSNAACDTSLTPFWDPGHYHRWWNALTGVGYMKSMQKHTYLPEHHTDFIFAIGAEELGFMFSGGMFLLFTIFYGCCLAICRMTKDRFGMYIVFGLGFMVYFQALCNMGVVSGVLPPKGLALPFVSYGGTHILITGLEVGMIFSVSLRNSLQNGRRKSRILQFA